jgi:hypothetical protein
LTNSLSTPGRALLLFSGGDLVERRSGDLVTIDVSLSVEHVLHHFLHLRVVAPVIDLGALFAIPEADPERFFAFVGGEGDFVFILT